VACSRRLPAAAAFSSTSAALCCVVVSRSYTARPMSPMPDSCCTEAVVISLMSVETSRTRCRISAIVAPACTTSRLPPSTRSTLSEISAAISLAASALRWASERTSLATTAKPRPCSPARAASTAAFSARMLVWKAMPSMTPMISVMRVLEA
jgi:hypothetical protein